MITKPLPKGTVTAKPLMLGNLQVHETKDVPTRIALLLWGDASVGKTTFAATAPGKKLWLNLDPDGRNSLLDRDDILVVDLDPLSVDELFNKLQNDNPLELDQFLSNHPEIETVVLDSATALSFRALQKVVRDKVGASRKENFTPSIEAPGISAYGGRNNVVITCLTGLLKVTAKHNRHFIVTTHEDDPKLSKEGEVEAYSMVLGGKMVSGFTWRLSEIWYMSIGHDGIRRLAVWPTLRRKPMKSRIFAIGEQRQFILPYDASKWSSKQDYTLEDIYDRWMKGGCAKLAVPDMTRKVKKL